MNEQRPEPSAAETTTADMLRELCEAQREELRRLSARLALAEEVVDLVKCAGVGQLSRGVELGPVVWLVKMVDAIAAHDAAKCSRGSQGAMSSEPSAVATTEDQSRPGANGEHSTPAPSAGSNSAAGSADRRVPQAEASDPLVRMGQTDRTSEPSMLEKHLREIVRDKEKMVPMSALASALDILDEARQEIARLKAKGTAAHSEPDRRERASPEPQPAQVCAHSEQEVEVLCNGEEIPRPYFIEATDTCAKCGVLGWDIMEPDGRASGTTYDEEDDATDQVDALNDAFGLGFVAGRAVSARKDESATPSGEATVPAPPAVPAERTYTRHEVDALLADMRARCLVASKLESFVAHVPLWPVTEPERKE